MWRDIVKKNKTVINIIVSRSGYRTAATSKMECFVIIVNGWKPLTIITKRSILDVQQSYIRLWLELLLLLELLLELIKLSVSYLLMFLPVPWESHKLRPASQLVVRQAIYRAPFLAPSPISRTSSISLNKAG